MRADTPPVLELRGVTKNYHGLRPLRLSDLRVMPAERVALGGIDVPAAEILVALLTGTSLPDAGEVSVLGRRTADIASEAQWLASLDLIGLVSHRAALLEGLTVAQNLALPFTIELDPIPVDVWPRVEALAAEVGLDAAQLDAPLARLRADERLRVHTGRALALDPSVLVLEHPTKALPRDRVAELGRAIVAVASRRSLTVLLISEDDELVRTVCTRRLVLQPATGALRPMDGWRRWFQR